MFMLAMLAQASQPAPVSWDDGIIHIIRELATALGGTAGIISILIAWSNRKRLSGVETTATSAAQSTQNIATRTEQIAGKVNEVAKANPAEVAPLPPPPAPLIVNPPTGESPTPPSR